MSKINYYVINTKTKHFFFTYKNRYPVFLQLNSFADFVLCSLIFLEFVKDTQCLRYFHNKVKFKFKLIEIDSIFQLVLFVLLIIVAYASAQGRLFNRFGRAFENSFGNAANRFVERGRGAFGNFFNNGFGNQGGGFGNFARRFGRKYSIYCLKDNGHPRMISLLFTRMFG